MSFTILNCPHDVKEIMHIPDVWDNTCWLISYLRNNSSQNIYLLSFLFNWKELDDQVTLCDKLIST